MLWLRQIVGEGPQFDVEVCRRRSLFTTDVTVAGEHITFPQPPADTGEYGIILPADPDQIQAIDAWDTWKLSAISAEEEARLEALEEG